MSRYYTFIVFILLFTGCSMRSATNFVAPPLSKNSVNNNFNEADLYLLYALDSEYRQEFNSASLYYEKLYDVNQEALYIHQAIKNRILAKDYDEIKRLVDIAIAKFPQDNVLKRYLAAYYIDMHNYKKAKVILTDLISLENNLNDQELLASVHIGLGENKKALSYYQRAYKQDKSAKALIHLVNLLYYKMNKKEKAKKLLHSHIDFVACDEVVCYKLLDIYQKEKDLKGLVHSAEKLYNKTRKLAFAKMVLEIYSYQKDYDSAITFLENSHVDDDALLELYLIKKRFLKAAALASIRYKNTKDLHYLAQMAMIEYESGKKPLSKKRLQSVEKKFNKVITSLDDPTYNNFYGYVLIDHDIDIKKGMKLIKKALKKEPNAPYYIDSLAWGHYKLGECQKAYDTIYPILNMVKEPEIKEHYQKIKACTEGKK